MLNISSDPPSPTARPEYDAIIGLFQCDAYVHLPLVHGFHCCFATHKAIFIRDTLIRTDDNLISAQQ